MAILRFKPIYQHRIWGAQNLKSHFNRDIPTDQPIGESWELVDRPEAQSVTTDGVPLHDLWTSPDKAKIFGTAAPDCERFPILIKLLDCAEKLSLQVHPPSRLAPKFNGEPKTEMWYFLHTEPDAEIYVGLKRGITQEAFAKAIESKTVADCFHRLKTSPRETMFLPSGRVHAIGGGNIILEIQQNSDTTFRVYDWDRVDASGKGRELHVEPSLECINFNDFEPTFTQPHGERIVSTEYFNVTRASFYEKESRDLTIDPASCQYVQVTQGSFRFSDTEWKTGDAALITADTGSLEIETLEDFAEMVCVSFP